MVSKHGHTTPPASPVAMVPWWARNRGHTRNSSNPPRSRALLRLTGTTQDARGRATPDFSIFSGDNESNSVTDEKITRPSTRGSTFRRFLNGIVPSKRTDHREPTPTETQLVMPSARKSMIVLDDSSSIGQSDDEMESGPVSPVRTPYVPPRHAWSVAQAYADAAAEASNRTGSPAPIPSPALSRHSTNASLSTSSSEEETQGFCAPFVSSKTLIQRWFWKSQSNPHGMRADVNVDSTIARLLPHMWKFVALGLIFVMATAVLGYLLSTLPLKLPTRLADLTLAEIRDMCEGLRIYAGKDSSSMWHVFSVLSVLFTWKQAFCVPGSIIMNIIFGAMYGAYCGTIYTSVFTAVGGVLCYLLAAPFSDIAAEIPWFAHPLHSMRTALTVNGAMDKEHGTNVNVSRNIWSYLMILRLLPIVPYGMMNIACGVLYVPLLPYAVTLGLGSVPWNFCTTQLGEIIQDVVSAVQRSMSSGASVAQGAQDAAAAADVSPATSLLASDTFTIMMDHLCTPSMFMKLALLSAVSMLPVFLNRYLSRQSTSELENTNDDEREGSFVSENDGAPGVPCQNGQRLSSVAVSA